jgi:hypothetical protein
MPEPLDGKQLYLEYLDKEMTIMGILSTFCVAVAALVIDRVGNALPNTLFARLLTADLIEVLTGAGLIMVAALYFYLQRSLLAYFYGSICFSLISGQKSEWNSHQWLDEASSWAAWLRYRLGCMFLAIAFFVFMHVIYVTLNPFSPPLFWLEWTVIIVTITCVLAHHVVLSTYRYKENPYEGFSFRAFLKDWPNRGQQ